MILFASVLVPVAILPTLTGAAGRLYGAEALLFSTLFLLAAIRFARRRDSSGARWLFAASLLYLPLLWATLLINRL